MKTKMLNYLQRNLIAKLLVLVLFLSINAGLIVAIKTFVDNRETPIANHISAKPKSFDYDSIKRDFESIGGEISTYDSEEEYLKAELEKEKRYKRQVETFADETFNPVVQEIVVIENLTGDVLPNALVRIDGVPRFTGRDGKIKTTIDKPTVELIVEVDGYNPEIFYPDINGSTITVRMRKPSDELEIFAVMLHYDGDTVNLLTQDYGVDKDAEYDKVYANLQIVANRDANQYMILQNGSVVLENDTGIFENIDIENTFAVGDDISVQFLYDGIYSKEIKTKLEIVDTHDINLEQIVLQDASFLETVGFYLDDPILGSVLFGFLEVLNQIFASSKKGQGTSDKNFEFVYDNRNKTFKVALGVRFDIGKVGTVNDDRKETLATYDSFKRSMKTSKSRWEKGDFASLKTALHNSVKPKQKKETNFTISKIKSLRVEWEFYGFLEFKYSNDVGKYIFNEASLGLSLTISFKIGTQVVVWIIPFYIYLELGGGFNVEISISNKLNLAIKLIFNLFAKVGAGIGLESLAYVGVWGKFQANAEFGLSTGDGFYTKGWGDLIGGVEARFLMFNESWQFWNSPSMEWWDTTKNKFDISSNTKVDKLSTSVVEPTKLQKSSNAIYQNSYTDIRPQALQIGDQTLLVWVDSDNSKDELNSTGLMYSVLENDTWSIPQKVYDDNRADFYPSLQLYNNEAYLVWHKVNQKITKRDTIESISNASDIMFSKFDTSNNSFEKPTQITHDDGMQSLPQIALDPSGQNPLTVLWLENSENDIFGNTGINSIQYSTFENNNWSSAKTILESDTPVTSYTSAYANNALQVATAISNDSNILEVSNSDIYLASTNKDVINLTNSDSLSTSPQFVVTNDRVQLLYYNNGILSYDILQQQETIILENTEEKEVSPNFVAISNGTSVNILYPSQDENSITQLNKIVYDSNAKRWVDSIQVTNSTLDIDQFTGIITDSGKLLSIYSQIDRDDDGKIITSTLNFDIDKTADYDLILRDIYYDEVFQTGQNSIYLDIANVGSKAFDTISVDINNITQVINLDEILLPMQSTIVEVLFDYKGEERIKIVAKIYGNIDCDYDNNEKVISTQYVSYDMNIDKVQVDEHTDRFRISISNLSHISDNIRILVKDQLDGSIVYTISEYVAVETQGKISFELILDYKELNIVGQSRLCFVIDSQHTQFSIQYDYVIVDGYTPPDNSQYDLYAKYNHLLNIAKGVS